MSETILDHPNIRQVLFHPRGDYGFQEPGAYQVSIYVEEHVALGGVLFPAQPEAPAILYYHGNGEIAADYYDLADFYNQIGISLLVMDYRGYGTSGGYPTASNLVSDAVDVFPGISQVFADHELAPPRLYVMGRSLGSVPAIELAVQKAPKLAGLIIESGFSDTFGLIQRLGIRVEGADEQRDGFRSGWKMEQVTIPTLVLHGQSDVLIPATDGKELFERCGAATKRLVLIPGAGHNDIMMVGMREYFAAIRLFVHPEKV